MLADLKCEPGEDSAALKRVRQSGRFPVWRVAHPFHPDVAMRLIVWFPPGIDDHVVVALVAANKAQMGDVFYDSVGVRADGGDRSVDPLAAARREGGLTMTDEKFIRGNERLERALSDPAMRTEVTKIRADMAQADREHAMHLASIRKAADLTQVELAARMGIKQAAVSGLEAREDMLLSTLANYLRAAGATEARVVIVIGGQQIEYPLPQLPSEPRLDVIDS